MGAHDDLEALGRLEKAGAVVVWPTRGHFLVEELRALGEPLRGLAPDVLRELADNRG